jgi:hypothetical protein
VEGPKYTQHHAHHINSDCMVCIGVAILAAALINHWQQQQQRPRSELSWSLSV